ncbi:MAG: hypothetical protein AAGA96_17815, partial [Verrucomicrobiota bacterium]
MASPHVAAESSDDRVHIEKEIKMNVLGLIQDFNRDLLRDSLVSDEELGGTILFPTNHSGLG